MKNKQRTNKHHFALQVENLSQIARSPLGRIKLTDKDLVHRLIAILRLEIDDILTFFDRVTQCVVQIIAVQKNKSVECEILEQSKVVQLQPYICMMLPLLKKESFETALYSLAELGVNQIQLIKTAKSQPHWTAKDTDRAHKIILAAAEQSKNFAYPELLLPIELTQIIVPTLSAKLFFDPAGESIQNCLEPLVHKKNVVLCIGPEGDMTEAEKEWLKNNSFVFCALTPTVLRACQAAALSAGIIRSYLE